MTYLSNLRGDLIPGADDGYSIGSPSLRWRDGYFANNSLHIVSTSGETGVATDWNLSVISDGYFNISNVNDGYLTITNFGNIGIGTNTPAAQFHVVGKSPSATVSGQVFGDDIAYSTATGRTRVIMGNTAANSELILGQDSTHGLLFNWTYNATAASAYGVLETFAGNNPLALQTAGGSVGIGTTNPTSRLHIRGAANTENIDIQTTAAGGGSVDLYASGTSGFRGPSSGINTTSTYPFVINTSSVERMRFNDSEAIVNDGAANYDFRVEGQTDANLLFVDASANSVGIGTNTPSSIVQINGSMSLPITTKTADYTATINDHTILCNATSGIITITLPTAVGIDGRIYVIKKIDSSANAITIDGNGSETIDGATTQVLSAVFESITIQSNGTAWYII